MTGNEWKRFFAGDWMKEEDYKDKAKLKQHELGALYAFSRRIHEDGFTEMRDLKRKDTYDETKKAFFIEFSAEMR